MEIFLSVIGWAVIFFVAAPARVQQRVLNAVVYGVIYLFVGVPMFLVTIALAVVLPIVILVQIVKWAWFL